MDITKVSLVTIPHTGTWFFQDLFQKHGIDVKAYHCTDNGLERADKDFNEGRRIVTTYRGIDLIRGSWLHRGRDLKDWGGFFENWYRLSCRYDPIVVSVDPRVGRDEVLETAGKQLVVSFVTQWEIVNGD